MTHEMDEKSIKPPGYQSVAGKPLFAANRRPSGYARRHPMSIARSIDEAMRKVSDFLGFFGFIRGLDLTEGGVTPIYVQSPKFQEVLSMQVRPLHDRVLVKRLNEEEKTKGGIIIPDTAKEKPAQGEIIAVGQGRVSDDGKVRALDVKKGDKVLFGKYAGTEIKLDGEEFLIMREEDIQAVFVK
jgi:chaperonin GroES